MSSKEEGKFAEKTSEEAGPVSTPSKKKKKKKKKKTPRAPAPPRPPEFGDQESDSGMPTVEAELSDGGGGSRGGSSKTSEAQGKPAHAGVFRSAESDEEDNIPEAASIMPEGEIDMSELMMNIRSAPGSLEEEGTPEMDKSILRRGRRGMSKLNDESDGDDDDIPMLGASSSQRKKDRHRERDRDRERDHDRDRGRDRDRDRDRGRDQDRDRDRGRDSASGEGKSQDNGERGRKRHNKSYAPSESEYEDDLTSADRAAVHASRAAKSLPDAVVRAVGYHERVIQLMQRDDFDSSNPSVQSLMTFTKSCRRTAQIVEGVLADKGISIPRTPRGGSGSGRAFSPRDASPKGEAAYNPKEDAIREETKTDLQEIIDDINRIDEARKADSGSSRHRKSKGAGGKKKEMHPKLLRLLNSSGFDIVEFLRSPVPKELGMIQFRIVGDHNDNELFVLFDYSDEPDTQNLVMTCDRAKARMLGGKKKIFDIRTDDMLLGRCERIKKGKVLQFNIYSNEAAHEEGTDSVFSSPQKMKSSSGRGKSAMGALRRQLGAVEISNSKDKPRGMMVLLPELRLNPATDELEPVVWQPWHEKEEMLPCYHAGHFEHISFWENKKPQYDEDLGAYTLDFDGRVTMASSKNFLLVRSTDINGPVSVRFGRVEESQFVMDVGFPCSPLQGMGVALASMLTKTTG